MMKIDCKKQQDFNQCVRELNIAEHAEPIEVEGKEKFDGYYSEAEAAQES